MGVAMLGDMVTAGFECGGAFAILLSIRRLIADKRVAGLHWGHLTFFAVWGVWNLYYYPHLGQWWAFAGGVGIVTANTVYLALVFWYLRWPGGRVTSPRRS